MKKIGFILFIALAVPFFVIGEETGFKRNIFTQWQNSLEENGIPAVPVFFLNKVNSGWIGFGFMLNSPESLDQDSPFRSLLDEFPLFRVALVLQGKNMSSSIVFNYEKNNNWGVNAKFSF